ncbi:MAG: hypothetical protein H6812_08335 [Phycisphaeraceae bacterium]|nr:hypothetical protein [Phycisphaerales bacterium]MCB9843251.1 hypothetical protein [Phycisphaeraceae bacterium]
MRYLALAGVVGMLGVAIGGVSAAPVVITRDAPDLDRWMYPFNSSSVGTRPGASCFGALGQTELAGFTFDERDAQVLVGFDLSADVPADLCRYRITQATVRIAVTTDGAFVYDPTIDARETYFGEAMLPGGVADGDAGRPIEMFGVGYRNGFDAGSFVETSSFGPMIAWRVRNAFATDYASGVPRDVSNSLADGLSVTAFAVGTTTVVSPGAVVPANTDFRFDLDLMNPDVDAYLRDAISGGKLRLAIASMFPAESGGGGGPGTGAYPTFYMKENIFGAGRRARLSLTIEPCIEGDVDCSGVVDVDDLNIVLSDWLGSGDGDANCDGITNVDDLNLVLGNWLSVG